MKRSNDDYSNSNENKTKMLKGENEKEKIILPKNLYTINNFFKNKNFLNENFLKLQSKQFLNCSDDFKYIKNIFQDCDPEYLIEKLEAKSNDEHRVESIVEEFLEKKSYPKLEDYMNKKIAKEAMNLIYMEFNIEDYLKLIPDPIKYFYETNKIKSKKYKDMCRVELENEFDFICKTSINSVLVKHNFHFTPSYRELENAVKHKRDDLKLRANRNVQTYLNKKLLTIETATEQQLRKIPKVTFSKNKKFYKLENLTRNKIDHVVFDVEFVKELLFIKNEYEIKKYLKEQANKYSKAFKIAKLNNNLHECHCCFEDNLLQENMQSCLNGHFFCKICIKRYAETNISDYNFEFKCIKENCDSRYNMETLSVVLDQNVFDKLSQNIQNEEIIKANLNNLESCPFCTYCVIIENKSEKIFKCLNPDCMKESCLLCKEPNHLPFRCNEIEQQNEIKMRTWIENKITESMVRVCKSCNKRFYKVYGCNLMKCVCGAYMCYVCRQSIPANVTYNHFSENGCRNDTTNSDAIHLKDSEIAYKEAKEIYLKEHPEMVDVILKHDPKENLIIR